MKKSSKNPPTIQRESSRPNSDRGTQLKIHCQYCRDYLCIVTQTDCGHIFCEACIEDYLLYLDQCPVCERTLRQRSTYGNFFLDNIINDYLRLIDKQEHLRLQQRLKQRKSMKLGSSIGTLHCGLRLDVRDRQYIWRKGIVSECPRHRNDENGTALIRYDHSNESQMVFFREKRLAVYGTFTNRKQLPHYEEERIIIERHGMRFELTEWNELRRNKLDGKKLDI